MGQLGIQTTLIRAVLSVEYNISSLVHIPVFSLRYRHTFLYQWVFTNMLISLLVLDIHLAVQCLLFSAMHCN